MNELVSIITPMFNSEKYISETIGSVIAQTYTDWEMIIVDDCSLDFSAKIVEEYSNKDSRIKLVKLNKNSGPAIARNKAIKNAKGRFIAFLDSDDLWKPSKLQKQIEFMQLNKCLLSYSYYEILKDQNKNNKKLIMPPLKINYKKLLKTNHIGCLTAVYDADKLGKIYFPLIEKRQDYGLWLLILKKIKFAKCIPISLAIYREAKNSISSNKIGLIKYNFQLFRNIEKISFIKSVYYVVCNILYKVFK